MASTPTLDQFITGIRNCEDRDIGGRERAWARQREPHASSAQEGRRIRGALLERWRLPPTSQVVQSILWKSAS